MEFPVSRESSLENLSGAGSAGGTPGLPEIRGVMPAMFVDCPDSDFFGGSPVAFPVLPYMIPNTG